MKNSYFLTVVLFVVSFSGFSLNPSREYKVTPEDFGMKYTDVKILTEDGVELFGWMFKANVTSYKIIVLSDDGDGNMSDLLEIASSFLSLGYHVLTYDYRGYGKSGDFNIDKQFFIYPQFERDLDAVVDFLKKNHANIPKIHLFGMGIGASLSICVATNRKIPTVIADSPYLTLEDIQEKIKETNTVEVKMPLGYDKTRLEPKYAVESKSGNVNKIFLIVGQKDLIYNEKYVKELLKIRKDLGSVYVVSGATSSDTFSTNKNKYFTEIKAFLE